MSCPTQPGETTCCLSGLANLLRAFEETDKKKPLRDGCFQLSHSDPGYRGSYLLLQTLESGEVWAFVGKTPQQLIENFRRYS